MIKWNKEVDHSHEYSEDLYIRILNEFKKVCIEQILDRKTLQSKRRIVQRDIERKQCDLKKEIKDNLLIHTFTSKGRVVGVMTVTFLNFPIETETEPGHE